MTLTEFLLARIAEDEGRVDGISQAAELGHVIPEDWQFYIDRMAAECEAKRRIVDEASELLALNEGTSVWMAAAAHARRTLRHLAAVYADHRDYRPEWKQQ